VLARLERQYRKRYGKRVRVSADAPLPDVLFGYALDLSRCVGCRRCVYACVEENNNPRPQIHWITVLQMDQEKGVDLSEADPYYDPQSVPQPGHFYVPVQCQQCRKPPASRSVRWAPPGRSRMGSSPSTTTGAWVAAAACRRALTARGGSTG